MKKTLLITSYFPPRKGGISNFLLNIFNSFDNDFFVLTDQFSASKTNNRIIRFSFFSKIIWPRWLPLVYKIYKQIKLNNIELLQAGQLIPIGTICYLLNKMIGIKYHVYVYGQDLLIARDSKRKTKIIHKVLKNADKIIACSNYTKQLAVKNGANENNTIVVYPIPKNLKIESLSPEQVNEFKKEKGLENRKVILSVGNLVKRKGQDMVIKSIAKIKQNNSNILYIIIGSGPNIDDLRKLIVRLDLVKYVKILEHVTNEELPIYYSVCDIFIMPSRYLRNNNNQPIDVEGFGMVFLEANLYGKPVIGGLVGGQIDAIEDNVSGYLVDPENLEKITEKIQLLLNNSELANELGLAGKKRALENFNWDIEIEKIKKIID
ncbi:MAG: glycosyltransferase family 4 protein [Candidatus Kerfeldbacteria bacterium]|jgi:phosphatidyl-myo-inositol dimannoside synthase